jgi:hypothetical protein
LLLIDNASQECHCGGIDPTSYFDQTLRDDKDKNHNRSSNVEIKTAAVKDTNQENNKKILTQKSEVKQKRKHKN